MKLTQGVHYKAVSSDLSVQKTREVLAALERPEILGVLEKHPIHKIVIVRSAGKQRSGEYDWKGNIISVNSIRKLGIQYGERFRPGVTRNISVATMDRMESMRRSLLQEAAHHIENSVPGLRQVIRAAYRDPSKRSITIYAGELPEEYFAESFVAAIVERAAFEHHDPVGSKMIEQALVLMRNQQ